MNELKLSKQDKKNMFCNICCSETIGKILDSKVCNDYKIELFNELFDYVERHTYYNLKRYFMKRIRKSLIPNEQSKTAILHLLRKINIYHIL